MVAKFHAAEAHPSSDPLSVVEKGNAMVRITPAISWQLRSGNQHDENKV
jgi:hypothetical protein